MPARNEIWLVIGFVVLAVVVVGVVAAQWSIDTNLRSIKNKVIAETREIENLQTVRGAVHADCPNIDVVIERFHGLDQRMTKLERKIDHEAEILLELRRMQKEH